MLKVPVNLSSAHLASPLARGSHPAQAWAPALPAALRAAQIAEAGHADESAQRQPELEEPSAATARTHTGPKATELIAEAIAVIEPEGTVEEMMFTLHARPTPSESRLDAYAAVGD